jgi:hypothetical protein
VVFVVDTVQLPSYLPILALIFSWSSHLRDSKWVISPTAFGRWRPKKHSKWYQWGVFPSNIGDCKIVYKTKNANILIF